LQHFLDGSEQLNSTHAVSHRDCDLGKWLYSSGMKQYGDMDAMREMEQVHEKMHGYIGDLIRSETQGDRGKARELFSKVESCSDTVVDCLYTVEKTLKNS
jgi:hypothetical protein